MGWRGKRRCLTIFIVQTVCVCRCASTRRVVRVICCFALSVDINKKKKGFLSYVITSTAHHIQSYRRACSPGYAAYQSTIPRSEKKQGGGKEVSETRDLFFFLFFVHNKLHLHLSCLFVSLIHSFIHSFFSLTPSSLSLLATKHTLRSHIYT
jgi:hypothetical protein